MCWKAVLLQFYVIQFFVFNLVICYALFFLELHWLQPEAILGLNNYIYWLHTDRYYGLREQKKSRIYLNWLLTTVEAVTWTIEGLILKIKLLHHFFCGVTML